MKKRDPKKVEMIYNATLALVANEGLASLTMASLSESTGLGMGTIDNYFSSKDDIVNELYSQLGKRHSDEIFADIVDKDPFMVNFKRVFNNYISHRWNYNDEFTFIDQYNCSSYANEDAMVTEEAVYGPAYRLLDRGKTELIVKYVDNKVLLSFITGGIKGIVSELKKYELELDQQTINTTFDLCVSVIKK